MDMPANTVINAANFDSYKNPPYISIVGTNRNRDTGIFYDVPAGKTVYIKKLRVENTFIPLIKGGPGQLTIEELEIRDFGGDAINVWGSNVRINNLIIRNSTPTRPYNPIWVAKPDKDSIIQALQQNNETVYNWALLDWIPVTDSNNITSYYTPGYHVDAGLQAYYKASNPPPAPKARRVAKAHHPSVNAAAPLADRTQPLPTLTTGNIKDIAQTLYVGPTPPLRAGAAKRSVARPPLVTSAATPTARAHPDPTVLRLLQTLARENVPYEIKVTNPDSRQISEIIPLVAYNPVQPLTPPLAVARPGPVQGPTQTTPVVSTESPPLIANIHIEKADINTDSLIKNPKTLQTEAMPNHKAQIFMFSEPHRYSDIHIGHKGLTIKASYSYWFSANTLDNSTIGSYTTKPQVHFFNTRKAQSCTELPCVRIGDGTQTGQGTYGIKPSPFATYNVTLINLGKPHQVPPQVTYREALNLNRNPKQESPY